LLPAPLATEQHGGRSRLPKARRKKAPKLREVQTVTVGALQIGD